MKRLLLALAGASFVVSQVIAAAGWIVDVVTRFLADLFAGASEYLKDRAR